MAAQSSRTDAGSFWLITLLKAVGAQCIVVHHLAFYGPMSDHVRQLLPQLIGWLDDHARIAVQVFLAVGGFLAAGSLCRTGRYPSQVNPARLILRRYAKLAPPFWCAMLLAVAASAWASQWMAHYSISEMPDALQLLSHLLLLHGVLGQESLSAGAWYVAIDLQLYALSVLLIWFAVRWFGIEADRWLPILVLAGIAASVLVFNRHPEWDDWAPYFFGSYGLGILAWWASEPSRRPAAVTACLGAAAVLLCIALALEFRVRLVVASLVALTLFVAGRAVRAPGSVPESMLHFLGRISYSVFLVHFPVCLVVNAAFIRYAPHDPSWQALGMVAAWAASLLAGTAFHRWVEQPCSRLQQRLAQQGTQVAPGRVLS